MLSESQSFQEILDDLDIRPSKKCDVPSLANVLVFFAGPVWADAFLHNLPIDQTSSIGATLIPEKFSSSVANDDTEFVGDSIPIRTFGPSHADGAHGRAGIRTISFDIDVQNKQWIFPFVTPTASKHTFVHKRKMRITLEGGAHPKTTLKGEYWGMLGTHYIKGYLVVQPHDVPRYFMMFSNVDYIHENHSLLIRDIGELFEYGDLLSKNWGDMAGHFLAEESLRAGAFRVTNAGFAFERALSTVFLKEISGDLDFDTKTGLLNSSPIQNIVPTLKKPRLILLNVGSSRARTLILQLRGDLNFDHPVPFWLSLGLSAQGPSFELAIIPKPNKGISIRELLNTIGLSSIQPERDFPPGPNLSDDNSLYIYNATIAWRDRAVDHLTLGVGVSNWVIVEKFEILDLTLLFHMLHPTSAGKRFSLLGSGVVKIGGFEVGLSFGIDHSASGDVVTFQLATAKNPLKVGALINHFFAEASEELPAGILIAVNINTIIVQGVHDARLRKWTLSNVWLETEVSANIEIYGENFKLSNPTLTVGIEYPFEKDERKFYASMASGITLGEAHFDTWLSFQAGKDGAMTIEVGFEGWERPLSLSDVLYLFSLDLGETKVPDYLEFLLTLGLEEFNLSLQRVDGKYGLSLLKMKATSTLPLKFWDWLALKTLSLVFEYKKDSPNEVNILATLPAEGWSVGFAYDGDASVRETEIQNLPLSRRSSEYSTESISKSTKEDTSASWSATVAYSGNISVLNALKDLTGSLDDLSDSKLGELLSGLYDEVDFNITRLQITLAHDRHGTSFIFSSDMSRSIFKTVEVYCCKNTSWLYYLRLDFADANIFEKFNAPEVKLKNTTVTFSNYDHFAIFPNDHPIRTSSNELGSIVSRNQKMSSVHDRRFRASFHAALQTTQDLDALKEFSAIDEGDIILDGEISKDTVSISVGTDYHVVKFPKLSPPEVGIALKGTLAVNCHFKTKRFEVGFKGDAKVKNFPNLSKDDFEAEFGLYLAFPRPQLGLQFELETPIENAFGVEGLRVYKFKIGVAFSITMPPVPSQFLVHADVQFKTQFKGAINFEYDQGALRETWGHGRLYASADVSNALTDFNNSKENASKEVVPKSLDGTFTQRHVGLKKDLTVEPDINYADLEFWASREEREIRVNNKQKTIQGLYLECDVNLSAIDFAAFFHIHVYTNPKFSFEIECWISKRIVVGDFDSPLLVLQGKTDPSLGPYLLFSTEKRIFQIDGEIHVLGKSFSGLYELSKDKFSWKQPFDFGNTWVNKDLQFDVSVTKTQLRLYTTKCHLDITIPKGTEIFDVAIPHIAIVELDGSLVITADRVGDDFDATKFTLSIWAAAKVFSAEFLHLDFVFGATIKDFKDLVEAIKEGLPEKLIRDWARQGFVAIVTFLSGAGLAAEECVNAVKNFIVDVANDIWKSLFSAVKSVFNPDQDEIDSILGVMGLSLEDVTEILEKPDLNGSRAHFLRKDRKRVDALVSAIDDVSSEFEDILAPPKEKPLEVILGVQYGNNVSPKTYLNLVDEFLKEERAKNINEERLAKHQDAVQKLEHALSGLSTEVASAQGILNTNDFKVQYAKIKTEYLGERLEKVRQDSQYWESKYNEINSMQQASLE